MTKKLTLSLLSVVAISSSAYAGKNVIPAQSEPLPVPIAPTGFYFGGGLTYEHSTCNCNNSVKFSNNYKKLASKSDTYGYNLKLGYDFNDYIGIEALYLFTPWGDTDKTFKHYGIYLKPQYPLSDKLNVYALLGYGKSQCEILANTFKGFSWGVGAQYMFNKKVLSKKKGLGVYVEYLRPLKKSGSINAKVDIINAGLIYNF